MSDDLDDAIYRGAASTVAWQWAKGSFPTHVGEWFKKQLPRLGQADRDELTNIGKLSNEAAGIIEAWDPDKPIPMYKIPVHEKALGADHQGARALTDVEVTVEPADGGPAVRRRIRIPLDGTETPAEIDKLAIDEMVRRMRKSPGKFGNLDPDQEVLVFTIKMYAILSGF